jgi:hypothetical protein
MSETSYALAPWVSVSPGAIPEAILGNLPFKKGTVIFDIPETVVPKNANGILVFVWVSTTGKNDGPAYWHMEVNIGEGKTNWFSLLCYPKSPIQKKANSYNSQSFWLPMPVDQKLSVTLYKNDLPGKNNAGEVEIHGYYP